MAIQQNYADTYLNNVKCTGKQIVCECYMKKVLFLNRICEELGTGEFGAVSRAMWKPTEQKKVEVAVKTLNTNVSTKDRVRFLQEAAIMCQFDHGNVVKLHGVVTDEPVTIVLEYVPNGDLSSVLMELKQLLVYKHIVTYIKILFCTMFSYM